MWCIDSHSITILFVMISTGIFGGSLNYLRRYYPEESKSDNFNNKKVEDGQQIRGSWKLFFKNIFLGVGATLLVPLFLKTISSDIITSTKDDPSSYLVLIGFCLLASLLSSRFMDGMAAQIMRKLEDTENMAREVKEEMKNTEVAVDVLVTRNTAPGNSETDLDSQKESDLDQNVSEGITETPNLGGIDAPKSESSDEPKSSFDTVALSRALKLVKLRDKMLTLNLSKNQVDILSELLRDVNYAFRTVSSLRKKLNMTRWDLDEELMDLERKGFIRHTLRQRDNEMLVALSFMGKMLYHM